MDLFLVILLRTLFAVLNSLPLQARLLVIESILRIVFLLLPKIRRVSLENLELAYPKSTSEWRMGILRQSRKSLARVIVDFARLPELDETWIREHIDFPKLERWRELNPQPDGKGLLMVTGHLGSFELLAHCAPLYGNPMSFVVRNAKLPRVDSWWRSQREANGNHVISRKGAFREILQRIEAGQNVGILFDQNVTKKHAVFVDWFGVPAATTKTVALSALRTECKVLVATVQYTGGERYSLHFEEFDFSAIYQDQTKDTDSKVFEITSILSKSYQSMIERSPHEWFWMHRRWRTRPDAK